MVKKSEYDAKIAELENQVKELEEEKEFARGEWRDREVEVNMLKWVVMVLSAKE